MFTIFLAKVIAIARKTAKATLYVEKTTAKESCLRTTTIAASILVSILISYYQLRCQWCNWYKFRFVVRHFIHQVLVAWTQPSATTKIWTQLVKTMMVVFPPQCQGGHVRLGKFPQKYLKWRRFFRLSYLQAWAETSPHSHGYTSLWKESNNCRNPDGEPGPWYMSPTQKCSQQRISGATPPIQMLGGSFVQIWLAPKVNIQYTFD